MTNAKKLKSLFYFICFIIIASMYQITYPETDNTKVINLESTSKLQKIEPSEANAITTIYVK